MPHSKLHHGNKYSKNVCTVQSNKSCIISTHAIIYDQLHFLPLSRHLLFNTARRWSRKTDVWRQKYDCQLLIFKLTKRFCVFFLFYCFRHLFLKTILWYTAIWIILHKNLCESIFWGVNVIEVAIYSECVCNSSFWLAFFLLFYLNSGCISLTNHTNFSFDIYKIFKIKRKIYGLKWIINKTFERRETVPLLIMFWHQ